MRPGTRGGRPDGSTLRLVRDGEVGFPSDTGLRATGEVCACTVVEAGGAAGPSLGIARLSMTTPASDAAA